MVLTIGPTVSRAERRQLLIIHGLGLVAGTTSMALVLTLLGRPIESWLAALEPIPEVLAAVVLVLWATRVLTGRGLAFPPPHAGKCQSHGAARSRRY